MRLGGLWQRSRKTLLAGEEGDETRENSQRKLTKREKKKTADEEADEKREKNSS